MLKITMFSSAETVPGQGVGSAYRELVNLLKDRFTDQFEIKINKLGKADISHYHTINLSFYLNTFLPGRGRKIGYVHFLPETLEGSIKLIWPFKQIFYRYVLAFYRRMDHIVVVNPTFIPKLEAAGIPTKDVTYIPNFVTKDEFYPLENTDKQIFRQDQGYKTDDFIILGVGQVQERKGIFDFIQLARDNPQWQFIWAGGFSFGGITAGYEELKKVVSNPPANLKFPGIVDRDQMNNYYNLANVFLLPSFNELFPMSALEAFSAGTPTILRDLDLYKEILAGYYLAAPDRDAMQKKLEQLQSDPKLQQEMINQALEASKRYSKDYVAGLWEKFYQEQAERK
ncbi:glycosyltransferase [Weissella koreensis KACC 15510]|uniref:glycosyltransferase family 4 protein n=1 Tax=Weissella koreensis TaxID=165096 RepID=UPI0002174B06|nr:glycosyltransferase family 4 protein [Weissella koreensis]AEJ23260.1 glycosyltransferase [Weissella koreensis KACC 15510]